MINMLLADTSDVVRIGIRSVLEARHVAAHIDEAANATEAMSFVAARDYQVLVIEPLLRKGGEETLVRRLRDLAPAVNILVFTSMTEGFFGRRMLKCGVRGYLMKTCSEEDLVVAIHCVAEGKMYLSERLTDLLATQVSGNQEMGLHEKLNEREVEVFSMMVCGKTTHEIAVALGIRSQLTSTYKARILKKLQVHSLIDAVRYAIAQDLLGDCQVKCSSPS